MRQLATLLPAVRRVISLLAPALVLAGLWVAPAPLGAQAAGTGKGPVPASAQAAAPRVSLIRVAAVDYAFNGPATAPAGVVVFNLVNNGSDLHQLAVLELPANRTLSEFLDTYHGKGIIPAWMAAMGQSQVISPNQEALLALRLKPGRYILACLMPARDGRAHTEKGMVSQLVVR